MSQSNNRLAFAHNLRGIAALGVVVTHLFLVFWYWYAPVKLLTGMPPLSQITNPPFISEQLNIIQQWVNVGRCGVALFFLISGFVIPFSLESYTRTGFLIGRFFRIWPTYLAALAVTLAAIGVASWYFNIGYVPSIKSVLASVLIAPDLLGIRSVDGVIWTLTIEVKFYLLMTLLSERLRRSAVSYIALAVGLTLLSLSPSRHHLLAIIGKEGQYLTWMFCGVLFNLLYCRLINSTQFTVSIIALIALFVLQYAHQNSVRLPFAMSVFASYPIALAVFLFCYWYRDRIGYWPIVSTLADISYPLYAVHSILGYVVIRVLLTLTNNSDLVVAVALLPVLIAAIVIHYKVEKPSNRLGKRWAKLLSMPKSWRFRFEARQSWYKSPRSD